MSSNNFRKFGGKNRLAKNYIVRNDTTITNHLTVKGEIINKGGAYNLWDDERGGKWQDLRNPTFSTN